MGFEVAVRVHVASGALERARVTCTELESLTRVIGTAPFRGSASLARGLVEISERQLEAARRCFEDAVDAFQSQGAPYETALARIELAHVLTLLGRSTVAGIEARAALATFEQLGAERDARRAAVLLDELAPADAGSAVEPPKNSGMTRREVEVLRLLARGYSNPQIAEQLFISVRTVERHISAIYAKLGAEGSAARAIATAYAIEHGLAQPVG
jgi:DNA-binding NarL/FixJ family response regulator